VKGGSTKTGVFLPPSREGLVASRTAASKKNQKRTMCRERAKTVESLGGIGFGSCGETKRRKKKVVDHGLSEIGRSLVENGKTLGGHSTKGMGQGAVGATEGRRT